MRKARSDQKHVVMKRPRATAARIGERRTAKPMATSDCAMKVRLSVLLPCSLDVPCQMIEAYKGKRLVARKCVTSLKSFIAGLRAHHAVGLARYKVESTLENAILGHAFKSHACWSSRREACENFLCMDVVETK